METRWAGGADVEELVPPEGFAIVEHGVFRSAIPSMANARFLESLHLKTVVILSRAVLSPEVLGFFEDQNISLVRSHDTPRGGALLDQAVHLSCCSRATLWSL